MPHSLCLWILILFTVNVSTVPTNDTESWSGKWFPQKEHTVKNNEVNEALTNVTDSWGGKWFPNNPLTGHTVKNNEVHEAPTNTTDSWGGKWFPKNILKEHSVKKQKVDAEPTNISDSWGGKWFPENPSEVNSEQGDLNELFNTNKVETNSSPSWKEKWFPNAPTKEDIISSSRHNIYVHPECDDGKKNIGIDFDPNDKRHSYKYLCLGPKSKYDPSYATSPILREYIVPPAYRAPSYCLNESIDYEERLPTFGAHRHLYSKYGEYKFLPIQRWMHNLEYGAIVMLYHPCAYKMQIEKLKNTLNACLYRHIITPSQLLLPERPLALVAWGTSLEMSVVDVSTVVDFIKDNAKKGPQAAQNVFQEYDAGLLAEAKLVTDESDSEICANINL